MMTSTQSRQKKNVNLNKTESTRSYPEVVAALNSMVAVKAEPKAAERIRTIEMLSGDPSKAMDIILVCGTNSKSITMNLTSKLLQKEGFKVGVFYPKNLISYNEQIVINGEPIQNKNFATVCSKILNLIEGRKIEASRYEAMLATAIMYFNFEAVDVAIIATGMDGKNDAAHAYNSKIVALTKVTQGSNYTLDENEIDKAAFDAMEVANNGTWFISAEQSKIRLAKMKEIADKLGLNWTMPIRRLAPLPYIFEQLFGKCASLAERIALIYCEEIKKKFSPFLKGNLLSTQKGQRGRPTLEAKREAEQNPVKTLKSFWMDNFELVRGQFELIENSRPTVLLDWAEDYQSLENLFLGIRLLHYKRPINGLAINIGLRKELDAAECLKSLRYLLKKVPGEVFFISLPEDTFHKPHELAQKARELGIAANVCADTKHAFETSRLIVDERDGIVCVTGGAQVVANYWAEVRDMKKL